MRIQGIEKIFEGMSFSATLHFNKTADKASSLLGNETFIDREVTQIEISFLPCSCVATLFLPLKLPVLSNGHGTFGWC